MHSSISLSLEPGLDRGVPWGRDLYTFVNSAAGHMMRTLQKPRKNRPSKRQVNHRRFLHNMIQRKFTDIEAANHRLASALYFKDNEKKPDRPEEEDSPLQQTTADENMSKSKDCITVDSNDTEIEGKKRPEVRPIWKQHPKSRKNKNAQKKIDQNLFEFASMAPTVLHQETEHFYDDENPTNTHFPIQEDSSFEQYGRDLDTSSPSLSPLSLDSCDLSVQMFTDISSCTPAQKSFGEITESQWADIIDLFSNGSKEFRTSTNVEAYFESICECHSDAEGRVGTDEELEDFFHERGQCIYDHNQGVVPNNFPIENISSILTSDIENPTVMHNFPSSNSAELISSAKYQCMSYQLPIQQSQCMLGQYELNPIPFEGVAQSFSAPSQNVPRCSIPTPPHEGDWLFTDILAEKTLMLT